MWDILFKVGTTVAASSLIAMAIGYDRFPQTAFFIFGGLAVAGAFLMFVSVVIPFVKDLSDR